MATLVLTCSGGTKVTVHGENLNSVAKPRLAITTVVSSIDVAGNTTHISVSDVSISPLTLYNHPRAETPEPAAIKFLHAGRYPQHYHVFYANISENLLRKFLEAGGGVFSFAILTSVVVTTTLDRGVY